jgi:hypothetical protein
VGEDRDGVYGKENRVYWERWVLLLKTSTVSFAASAQPHAVDPFVADVSGSKPLAARALAGEHLVADLAISTWRATCSAPFFGLSAHSAFIKIFCGDKAMHCLHFANINRGWSCLASASDLASVDADVRLNLCRQTYGFDCYAALIPQSGASYRL